MVILRLLVRVAPEGETSGASQGASSSIRGPIAKSGAGAQRCCGHEPQA